jgi:FkbM family methyltransferase
VHRLLHPRLVSFGLMANLKVAKERGVFSGIDAIVDVGANIGQFAYMISRLCPGVPVISVEPDPACFIELERTFQRFGIRGRCLRFAASDKSGEAGLNVHDDRVNNSLLASGPGGGPITSVAVQLSSLDALLADAQPTGRLLLKLDVQGYEMHVLRSAEQALQRCEAVIVEVSFERAYQGGATPAEILAWLDARGFAMHDILDTLRNPSGAGGNLREADLLFVRRRSGQAPGG